MHMRLSETDRQIFARVNTNMGLAQELTVAQWLARPQICERDNIGGHDGHVRTLGRGGRTPGCIRLHHKPFRPQQDASE